MAFTMMLGPVSCGVPAGEPEAATAEPADAPTDDEDEQGFRIYGVVGRTGEYRPELALRVGVYGHFAPVDYAQAFEGADPGIRPVKTEDNYTTRR